ncbi:MAG: carboxymuconolactone decarboxylase family protein [Spirochaetes bacterium]|nr:carboxymuconolactone decarboxylase family protein [Spirochaetota bacterium]
METQLELNEERIRLFERFKQVLPEVGFAVLGMLDTIYKDGALDAKTKYLIALAVALKAGCTNCILAQTTRALETGATKEEILETVSVVVAMSGTTGTAESLRVIKLLDEMGKLD